MADATIGRVQAIAIRQGKKGPMHELPRVRATAADGLAGDNEATSQRGVTFLASRQWEQVLRELDAELPWHTRRANVLIESGSLARLLGKTVQIGDVQVRINAETRPCGLMDELHPGLRAALDPDCRAGVYGSVVRDGTIAVGDVMTMIE